MLYGDNFIFNNIKCDYTVFKSVLYYFLQLNILLQKMLVFETLDYVLSKFSIIIKKLVHLLASDGAFRDATSAPRHHIQCPILTFSGNLYKMKIYAICFRA